MCIVGGGGGNIGSGIVIIIIIIININIIISKDNIPFMQGIYTYIPETNHVPKKYNVVAVLSLVFMAPISLAAVLAPL
jgi:hypothetical protein